jgi:hypothetical protein
MLNWDLSENKKENIWLTNKEITKSGWYVYTTEYEPEGIAFISAQYAEENNKFPLVAFGKNLNLSCDLMSCNKYLFYGPLPEL